MKRLNYIVTGTGRCGTVYMARLLTSVGIPCGHETIFDYRGIKESRKRLLGKKDIKLSGVSLRECATESTGWPPDITSIVADSSYMAAPFLKYNLIKNSKIIHVVRNPVNVVNSFCNYINYFTKIRSPENFMYEDFIYKHAKKLNVEMPQYDKAALYYITWNEMIENKNPDFLFRIEDDTKELLNFLGVQNETSHFNCNTVNTFKNNEVIFDFYNIENKQIRLDFINIYKKYGYNLSIL